MTVSDEFVIIKTTSPTLLAKVVFMHFFYSHIVLVKCAPLNYQFKSFLLFSIMFYRFIPHGNWSDPDIVLPIECPIYNHFLQSFTMLCNIQNFIFVPFIMTIFASDYNIHNLTPQGYMHFV